MSFLHLIVVFKPRLSACDESPGRIFAITQTFLSAQGVLFISVLIAPFSCASHLALIKLLLLLLAGGIFSKLCARVQPERVQFVFLALMFLLHPQNCEVTDQVFD